MKNKLIYLLVMVASVLFGILYEGEFLWVLLAFEMILAVCMFIASWLMAGGISVRLEAREPMGAIDAEVPVSIFVKNNTWLPVQSLKIRLECRNSFGETAGKEIIDGAVQGLSELRLHCGIKSKYCGQIQVQVKDFRVYDYLKLFSRVRKCEGKAQINVLPEVCQMEAEVTEKTRRFEAEGEEYELHQSGDDPSEIYQVREFRNGDTMQRVHWKLSARTDELMTKEFSMPKGCKVLFLLDFYREKKNVGMLDEMNAFLETAVSLSHAMALKECPHFVVWYDKKQEEIVQKRVQDEESFYELVEELLQAVFYSEPYDMEAGYRAEFPGGRFSTVLKLDEQLWLSVNGEQKTRFLKDELKMQLENYLLQV